MSRLAVVASFIWLVACLAAGASPAQQASPALAGTVMAGPEALEGVLVRAKKSGSTITTTVVSGKDGRYSFPAGRLETGAYSLRIRAVGYDLEGPGQVSVTAENTTTADLKLQKAKDLAGQLTSLEWVQSFPAMPEEKDLFVHELMSCAYCHTYQRIMKSKHSRRIVPISLSQ